ncbi:hypothetical protein [Streptomyces sp. NPDC054863]
MNANQPQERRRLLKGIAFVAGLLGSLAFFGFFPGLPHVIDGGAVLVSVGVGALAAWAYGRWTDRTDKGNRTDRTNKAASADGTDRTG